MILIINQNTDHELWIWSSVSHTSQFKKKKNTGKFFYYCKILNVCTPANHYSGFSTYKLWKPHHMFLVSASEMQNLVLFSILTHRELKVFGFWEVWKTKKDFWGFCLRLFLTNNNHIMRLIYLKSLKTLPSLSVLLDLTECGDKKFGLYFAVRRPKYFV